MQLSKYARKNSIMVVWCELKTLSLWITFRHHSYPHDGIFNPHHTAIKDSSGWAPIFSTCKLDANLFDHRLIGPRQANLVFLPMRAAKVQASLRIRAVSPEPSLLAHTSSESRGTFRQKARSLAPLNGRACAVEICHDGMLEDTNSLDGAQLIPPVFPRQIYKKKCVIVVMSPTSKKLKGYIGFGFSVCVCIRLWYFLGHGWLGRAMVLGSFQCRGNLLLWHMLEQGPAVLAAGAGWVGYFLFYF